MHKRFSVIRLFAFFGKKFLTINFSGEQQRLRDFDVENELRILATASEETVG